MFCEGNHGAVKKNDYLVQKNKQQNIVTVPCSLRKDQILTNWHFLVTSPNSDLNINNNMANKKSSKMNTE